MTTFDRTYQARAIQDILDDIHDAMIAQIQTQSIATSLKNRGVEHYLDENIMKVVAFEEHPLVTHFLLKHPEIIRVEKGGDHA